ncbi:hypothetical protein ECOPH_gp40 [Escherichia phage vB_EcoM_ECO1230-10]|uniref:Uncharacterized protein n=1 Tax=Escherichia phage vB_EcoM_ECO1230-10 TaxID=669875 RepID=D5LH14_9CAUD|nr:hypothetical protein ECOPH_gp40 [Escherichia phage vB_EcoM_ECO1230-10]ADE87945.1 hypothetical protein [Escherichia phage vB_EcoM_ECO1230-10]
MKLAQIIANTKSNMNVNAMAALEIIANENLPEIESISFHHREINFKDGSLIMIRDTTQARSIGLTESNYSIAYQDAAY